MRAVFRVQGITDEATTCECCGREGLKRTVRLIELDADGNDLDAVYYGTSCAATAARTTSTRIRNAAAAGDGLLARARKWAAAALPVFSAMSLLEYMAANPSLARRPAAADAALTATIAEARQIVETGILVGTRFARELGGLPTIIADKPAPPARPAAPAPRHRAPVSTVSAAQGLLF